MIEDDGLEQALDRALAASLVPPRPSPQLRVRLQAAMAQETDARIAQAHRLFEKEHRERQAALHAQYVKLRRQTLGVVVGGAFAAGAAATAVLPWLTAQLGRSSPVAVVCTGMLVGLAIGVAFWLTSRRHSGLHA
jgi:Flp pilus assembly protein TadB